jgi:hypothetical protein
MADVPLLPGSPPRRLATISRQPLTARFIWYFLQLLAPGQNSPTSASKLYPWRALLCRGWGHLDPNIPTTGTTVMLPLATPILPTLALLPRCAGRRFLSCCHHCYGSRSWSTSTPFLSLNPSAVNTAMPALTLLLRFAGVFIPPLCHHCYLTTRPGWGGSILAVATLKPFLQ